MMHQITNKGQGSSICGSKHWRLNGNPLNPRIPIECSRTKFFTKLIVIVRNQLKCRRGERILRTEIAKVSGIWHKSHSIYQFRGYQNIAKLQCRVNGNRAEIENEKQLFIRIKRLIANHFRILCQIHVPCATRTYQARYMRRKYQGTTQ